MLYCLARQRSDVGDIPLDLLPDLDVHLRAEGEVEVDARAELNEAKVLVDIYALTDLRIGDDTACDSPSDLTDEDAIATLTADDDSRALVVRAALRQVSREEATIGVRDMLDDAITGDPVDVHIKDAHEDRYLQAAAAKQLRLLRLLDDDDTAVSRTHDLQRAIAMLARLVAEEVNDSQIEEDRDSQEDVAKRPSRKESNEGIQPDKSDSKANEWAAPFFVK